MESLTFGVKFVALSIASELVISLHYKVRMFSIPIKIPVNVLCDNEVALKKSMFVDVALKKKHSYICFYRLQEYVASDILIVHKVGTDYNLSIFLQKK